MPKLNCVDGLDTILKSVYKEQQELIKVMTKQSKKQSINFVKELTTILNYESKHKKPVPKPEKDALSVLVDKIVGELQ